MIDDKENVFNFPEKKGVQKVHEVAASLDPYCRHKGTILDSDKRQLTCKKCGAIIEPFDWITERLKEDDRYFRNRALLKKEVSELRNSIKELKMAETNTKSRLRTARKGLEKLKKDAAESLQDAPSIDDLISSLER